jgi:hypothetical protein
MVHWSNAHVTSWDEVSDSRSQWMDFIEDRVLYVLKCWAESTTVVVVSVKELKWFGTSSAFVHWVSWASLQLSTIEAQWFQLQSELETWDRGEIPLLFSNDLQGCLRCMNHRQSTHHLAFDEPVSCTWTCGDKVIGYDRDSNPGSFNPGPNVLAISFTCCNFTVFLFVSDRH